MMDALYALDISVFHAVNVALSNRVFDVVMPFITDLNHQRGILYLVAALLAWAVWKGGTRGRWAVAVLIVTIVAADQFASVVVKEAVGRVRPCHELAEVRLLVDCGGGKSFPSSHAVNTFAGALVLGFYFPRALGYLLSFGVLVAYSRVYVGVHYPLDVIGGAVIGLLIAGIMLAAAEWIRRRAASSRVGG